MKKIFFIFILASMAWAKILIVSSVAPVSFLAQKIGGENVELHTLISADAHNYEPKPSDMKIIAKADVFLAIGVEFERVWLEKFKANAKNLLITKLDENITKIKQEHSHDHDHDHENDHESDHESELDTHIWLDPLNAKIIAQNIANTLIKINAQNQKIYEQNLNALLNELDELDNYAKTELAGLKKRAFIVYHPAWGYFAKRYDLEQISIEKNAKEPKINELASIIKDAKKHGVSVIFTNPGYLGHSPQVIASQIGAKIIQIDPLSNDYFNALKHAIKAFKDANSN